MDSCSPNFSIQSYYNTPESTWKQYLSFQNQFVFQMQILYMFMLENNDKIFLFVLSLLFAIFFIQEVLMQKLSKIVYIKKMGNYWVFVSAGSSN